MKLKLFLLCTSIIFLFGFISSNSDDLSDHYSAKPFTRWWWFASEPDTNDIKYQLDWLSQNNFGGVEIAFVYPYKGDSLQKRHTWLSPEWSEKVSFAKKYVDKLKLSCDFTFGTLWPFGDSKIPESEGTIFFGDSVSEKSMRLTWEHPVKGRVLNHLDKTALQHYSDRVGWALKNALKGSKSGLFCDSWEVETKKLWTKGFDKEFLKTFGYDIVPFMDSLYSKGYEEYFYDYTKLTSKIVLNEFYGPFTEIAHRLGTFSRAQCGGSPTDLMTAYALVDIPETEAILYEPNFSRIPASAALLSNKNIISSETFTCIYGWKRWPGPGPYQKKEQVADLKLIADALFANGVNMIFWHGMPYNKKGDSAIFYASVHVGPDSYFADEIPAFNKYMEKVSSYMRKGKSATSVGVYIPLEDSWMAVEYPDSLKFPWVWGQYELRYIRTPEYLKKFQPVWINDYFLKKSELINGILHCGDAKLNALLIETEYIDYDALKTVYKLAEKGFPICITNNLKEPGHIKHKDFEPLQNKIKMFPNVKNEFKNLSIADPNLTIDCKVDYFARIVGDEALIFFSNPKAYDLRYPIKYGQSFSKSEVTENAQISFAGKTFTQKLTFAPYQSLLLKIDKSGKTEFIDITFVPKTPVTE